MNRRRNGVRRDVGGWASSATTDSSSDDLDDTEVCDEDEGVTVLSDEDFAGSEGACSEGVPLLRLI